MKKISSLMFWVYLTLVISLFLPSRANEMTSSEGKDVKAWEPSIATHFQILFGPFISYLDYPSSIRNLEEEYHEEQRSRMWIEVLYWLPITLSGWLFILYPLARHRIKSTVGSRVFNTLSLILITSGGSLLIAHLFDWATIYEGYYHMGIGAYLLMLSYVLFGISVSSDLFKKKAEPVRPANAVNGVADEGRSLQE